MQCVKQKDVKVGQRYIAKVSGKITIVVIKTAVFVEGRTWWWATNLNTGKHVKIKSNRRLKLDLSLPQFKK